MQAKNNYHQCSHIIFDLVQWKERMNTNHSIAQGCWSHHPERVQKPRMWNLGIWVMVNHGWTLPKFLNSLYFAGKLLCARDHLENICLGFHLTPNLKNLSVTLEFKNFRVLHPILTIPRFSVIYYLLPCTSQGNQGSSSIFFLLVRDVLAGGRRVLEPGAEQGLDPVEAVGRFLGQAQGLAVPKAIEQHLSSDVTQGWVRSALRLDQREHQQQPHAGGEGSLLRLL